MQRVLIIGAYSAIAEALAREYARRGAALFLVGRNARRLGDVAADLRTRGAVRVAEFALDVNDRGSYAPMLDAAQAELGEIDVVLIAYGTLPRQADCDASMETALAEFATNGTSTIALAISLVPRLHSGASLVAISSVAGDRGRASNYLYGSAKAAVSAFYSGLGQRLHRDGIHVLVVKPGFVDTPMTRDFEKGALWASPAQVARGILRAIDKRKPVAYVPGFWWAIMQVIKNIPEFVFRRIRL